MQSSPVSWSDLSAAEKAGAKVLCEQNHLYFTRLMFKARMGSRFRVGRHHPVVGRVVDDVIEGRRKRVIINVPPGYTKAIDSDTPMWTPVGWRLARDIRSGDTLIGSGGQWTKVVGIAPQGVKPAYRVTFSDGASIIACDDHRWAVCQRYTSGNWRVLTTADLRGDLREGDGRKKWRIPVMAPDYEQPRSDLPIDPYLLGCWIGDGHTHQSAITTADQEIAEAFRAAGFVLKPQKHQNGGAATTYGINGGFHTKLSKLGLLGNKSVPDEFLLASPSDRLSLLQGWCDTDGGVNAENGQQTVSCSNELLAGQLAFLICSVGGTYRCYVSTPDGGRKSWRFTISMPIGRCAFRLSRKVARINPRREHNTPRRFIDTIEPVDPREMVCFAVDADDHLFCAGRDLIVTHNTEETVIALIARGMAKTGGKAKFIHASFNGELVNENSVAVKDTMSTEPYRAMWPIDIRDDIDAKGLWKTAQGGGMLAKPAGGPITGFRAGTMDGGFTGALVIDDPLKPDDALFEVKRKAVNSRWHSTFKSRLAVEDVPVIVIMQRLHLDDFSGYLLKGGAGCRWDHLWLPILIDNAAGYPAEFTHGDPIEHGLADGPLWDEKHTLEQIQQMRGAQGDPVAAFHFAAQYMQRPIALEGNLFKAAWLIPYKAEDLPPIEYRVIMADTAQKVGTRNDYTVFQHWGLGRDGRAYLLDQVRGKFEAPELINVARVFWQRCMALPNNVWGVLRYFGVEDKVSGTGLIQTLGREAIPVRPIERGADKDKYTRALDVVSYFANGLIRVPEADVAPWVGDWCAEILSFTGQGDVHDDQVDPTVDAIKDLLAGGLNYGSWIG